MEIWDFISLLQGIYDDKGLEDEGIEVYVDGAKVVGAEFDGNTSINLVLED